MWRVRSVGYHEFMNGADEVYLLRLRPVPSPTVLFLSRPVPRGEKLQVKRDLGRTMAKDLVQ